MGCAIFGSQRPVLLRWIALLLLWGGVTLLRGWVSLLRGRVTLLLLRRITLLLRRRITLLLRRRIALLLRRRITLLLRRRITLLLRRRITLLLRRRISLLWWGPLLRWRTLCGRRFGVGIRNRATTNTQQRHGRQESDEQWASHDQNTPSPNGEAAKSSAGSAPLII